MRVDKFLWCIRAFRTRNSATEACRKGRIMINDKLVKPSALVQVQDELAIRRPPIHERFRVLGIPKSRVGAKLLPTLILATTPVEDLEKQEIARKWNAANTFPDGRPGKKDRRTIQRMKDGGLP